MLRARIKLKVQPGARRTEFAGRYDDGWKLRVAAPPVDGKANEEIARFLAEFAGVPVSAVRIVRGASGTRKLVEIGGADPSSLDRAILECNGHPPDSGSAPPPEA